jgi:hypothetical protein
MLNRLISITLSGLLALVGPALAAHAADKPAPETSYYLGESKMCTPDGKVIRTSLSLVKRVVSPAEGRIEEHVLSIGEKEARAFVVIMDVKGAKFTMSERSDAFTGEGELVGDAWKWREWKSTSKLAGGAGTVTSEDKLTDRGLSARKTFAGPDGKTTLVFEESLAPVGQKTYEILYAKLAPAEKK